MGNLEKSIRHAFAPIGPTIRARKTYLVSGYEGEYLYKNSGYVSNAYADISKDGLVDRITVYVVGEARESNHYYDKDCVEITNQIKEYIKGNYTWNRLISEITDAVKNKIAFIEIKEFLNTSDFKKIKNISVTLEIKGKKAEIKIEKDEFIDILENAVIFGKIDVYDFEEQETKETILKDLEINKWDGIDLFSVRKIICGDTVLVLNK